MDEKIGAKSFLVGLTILGISLTARALGLGDDPGKWGRTY